MFLVLLQVLNYAENNARTALAYLSPVTNQKFYSLDTWSDLNIVVPQLSLTTATGWFADAHLGNRPQIPELGIAEDLHLSMRPGIGPGKLDFLLLRKYREPLGNKVLGLKISIPCYNFKTKWSEYTAKNK
jgi:hypothetical protein